MVSDVFDAAVFSKFCSLYRYRVVVKARTNFYCERILIAFFISLGLFRVASGPSEARNRLHALATFGAGPS